LHQVQNFFATTCSLKITYSIITTTDKPYMVCPAAPICTCPRCVRICKLRGDSPHIYPHFIRPDFPSPRSPLLTFYKCPCIHCVIGCMWYCRFHRISRLCDHLRVKHNEVAVKIERASFTTLEEVYNWALCARVCICCGALYC